MSATLLSGLTWKYILQKEVLGAQHIWSSYSAAAVSVALQVLLSMSSGT